MAYSGVIKFLGETGNEALVVQTDSGSTLDGYRLVRSATFSTKSVDDAISYTYIDSFTNSDTNWITIA